jgi:hypothetical protein
MTSTNPYTRIKQGRRPDLGDQYVRSMWVTCPNCLHKVKLPKETIGND